MNLDQILPSFPKGVASILNNIADQAVGFKASASSNVAKDYAVQVCGPVAGSIQYIDNLSLHYHAGDIDACWRFSGETGAAEVLTSEWSDLLKTGQKFIGSSPGDHKLDNHLAVQTTDTQQLLLHRPGKAALPVLATYDPSTEGNWIASRIVKRLEFEHQQARIHKHGPTFMGQSFERTRIFVDLTCGKPKRSHQCHHRFYVVNHCNAFDILLGEKLCE